MIERDLRVYWAARRFSDIVSASCAMRLVRRRSRDLTILRYVEFFAILQFHLGWFEG